MDSSNSVRDYTWPKQTGSPGFPARKVRPAISVGPQVALPMGRSTTVVELHQTLRRREENEMRKVPVVLVSMLFAVVTAEYASAESTNPKGAGMGEPKAQLDWVPAGKPEWHSGWMNGYARGLDLMLQHPKL